MGLVLPGAFGGLWWFHRHGIPAQSHHGDPGREATTLVPHAQKSGLWPQLCPVWVRSGWAASTSQGWRGTHVSKCDGVTAAQLEGRDLGWGMGMGTHYPKLLPWLDLGLQ